jgi:hypothetical protein
LLLRESSRARRFLLPPATARGFETSDIAGPLHRSCGRRRRGRIVAAANCTPDLWQRQSRHAAHASTLVWQDEAGETWVSYNDPLWIAKRHGLNEKAEMAARAMAAALQAVTSAATGL